MELTPLPVDELVPEIIVSLNAHHRLVLRAATGAGKTTRVPPALMKPQGQVVVLEPRRVAARAAAARVAEQLDVQLGREVGYQVRFDNKTSSATRLVYATEGIFLRRLQSDPFLDDVHTVVLDEFHERSLVGDTVLALLRLLQSTVRADLRLVVMSATLALNDLGARLEAPLIDSPGRSFPVDIEYLPRPDPRPVAVRVADAVRRTLRTTDATGGLGSVLAFLPGRGELNVTAERLSDLEIPVDQLYGDLPLDRQTRVLRGTHRRVVLATNVAETSVTVDGIGAVVDSGLHRELRFDAATGLDRLELLPISRAAADQRAGRAGRQGPGRALRLWTTSEQAQKLPASKPEIERIDLSAIVLFIAQQGEKAEDLPWLDSPPAAAMERARVLLGDLGALDEQGITELGRRLASLPVHPRLGRILLDGADRGCIGPAARLAALLSERDPVIDAGRPEAGRGRNVHRPTDSDLWDRLQALDPNERAPSSLRLHRARAQHILRSARQLETLAEKAATTPRGKGRSGSPDWRTAMTQCLLDAYPDRVAELEALGGDANEVVGRMVGDIGIRLSPRSQVALSPGSKGLAVCTELGGVFQAGDRRRTVVHSATRIDQEDLDPRRIHGEDLLVFDPTAERIEGAKVTFYRVGSGKRARSLELERRPSVPDAERAATLLAEQAKTQPEHALGLEEGRFGALRRRLAFVRSAALKDPLPDAEALPDWNEATWTEVIDHLAPSCLSFADLRRAAKNWIPHMLDHQQRATLDRLVPERIDLPNGRSAAVEYPRDGPPILAARIQDLFGWRDTPTILAGRQPLLLHLLAPNMRPQQITDDLRGFWTGSYELVRKELAGRYPKHAWPTNPLEATPITPRRGRRPQ